MGTSISMSYSEGMQLQPEFKDGICFLKSRENADEKKTSTINQRTQIDS